MSLFILTKKTANLWHFEGIRSDYGGQGDCGQSPWHLESHEKRPEKRKKKIAGEDLWHHNSAVCYLGHMPP